MERFTAIFPEGVTSSNPEDPRKESPEEPTTPEPSAPLKSGGPASSESKKPKSRSIRDRLFGKKEQLSPVGLAYEKAKKKANLQEKESKYDTLKSVIKDIEEGLKKPSFSTPLYINEVTLGELEEKARKESEILTGVFMEAVLAARPYLAELDIKSPKIKEVRRFIEGKIPWFEARLKEKERKLAGLEEGRSQSADYILNFRDGERVPGDSHRLLKNDTDIKNLAKQIQKIRAILGYREAYREEEELAA
jgi:hypothetical protein